VAVKGSLRDISLVDIIQLNCRNQEEAAVTLNHDQRQGTIYFAGGEIVHAEHEQDSGNEAIYQLLKWEDGEFVIEKQVASPQHSIQIPWRALLMQSLQRIDEEKGLAQEAAEAGLDRDVLQELADRLDGFVAILVINAEGTVITHLVVDDDFDLQQAVTSLSETVQQAEGSLAAMNAGAFEEKITITTQYHFITRPIGRTDKYVQIILNGDGNIGAARMYLAAYLVTREEELLEQT
jgi:predicted regulator of Ras-like GTPase activity (Roadblock/LC7/MglB family)